MAVGDPPVRGININSSPWMMWFLSVKDAINYLLSTGGLPPHASTHKSGGADSIKLDEFAAPTDVTTLNATTVAHGLLPKLSGDADQVLTGAGGWDSSLRDDIDTHVALTTSAHDGLLPATSFSGFSKITVGASAPGSPSTNDLWVDTT
jgi:hypothetical protein